MTKLSDGLGFALRGILGLSLGTVIGRALSTVGQLLLAFWLTPTEFGYWAAATSAISLLAGLANFGEVNAYLGGHGSTFRTVRRSTRWMNSGLMLLAAAVASAYMFADRPAIAWLAFIAAATIPITGDADLLYATGVKFGLYRRVVVSQILGGVAKILVGVVIAMTTNSAIAIAISTLVFYLVTDLFLVRGVSRASLSEGDGDFSVSHKSRATWAINSLAMSLPLQVGFLVAQFVATPQLLGLFYMTFQVTIGITSLVSGPLSRVSLATLGRMSGEPQLRTAVQLCGLFGAGMLIFASAASLALPLASPLIPEEWRAILPAVVVMFASMPVRMMGPVIDAYQQATNRWWQGTSFNLLDLIGTASASLFALTGDLLILVLAVSTWKILLALFRSMYVLRAVGWRRNAGVAVPAALGSILLCASTFAGAAGLWLIAMAFVIGATWCVLARPRPPRRRGRHVRPRGRDDAAVSM